MGTKKIRTGGKPISSYFLSLAFPNSLIMKKTYQKPVMEQLSAECSHVMAVSIITDGKADGSAEVMTKENNDWDIWGE